MTSIFFHQYFFAKESRAWIAALAWIAAIFIAAPIAPDIADWLRVRGFVMAAMAGLFVIPVTYLVVYLVSEAKVTQLRAYVFLTSICLFGAILTFPERAMIEHIHVLIYALLFVFLFKAAGFRLHGVAGYAVPLVIAVVIGFLDETWQGQFPNRGWDMRDVSDDAVGALIGLSFLLVRERFGIRVKDKT